VHQPQNYSEYIVLLLKRIGAWVAPDPADPILLSIVKTILKSVPILLLIVFSPVLVIGLFIAFIGLL
jgi:hypothetical protein